MSVPLTMKGFLERLRDALDLSQVPETGGLDRQVRSPNISSPGLVLAGYTDRFPSNRIQVLGETEMTYLASLSAQERRNILKIFFGFPIPGAIITKGQKPSAEMVEEAQAAGVALLVTTLKTNASTRSASPGSRRSSRRPPTCMARSPTSSASGCSSSDAAGSASRSACSTSSSAGIAWWRMTW
jgi:HPr kinase/phosphorylase